MGLRTIYAVFFGTGVLRIPNMLKNTTLLFFWSAGKSARVKRIVN